MERSEVSDHTFQDPITDPAPGTMGAVREEAKDQVRFVADTAVQETKGSSLTWARISRRGPRTRSCGWPRAWTGSAPKCHARCLPHLGNTPTVARNSYVPPELVAAYLGGEVLPAGPDPGEEELLGWEAWEQAALGFLSQ